MKITATLHVELPSNEVALLSLFVSEVAEELQTLGKPCGRLHGYKAKALYELRRAVGGLH